MNPKSRETPVGRVPWHLVCLAALAMVATLPGRSQGLGLVTEPLLRDLRIDRVQYSELNLWTTLAGSLFAVGLGRLMDRWGFWVLSLVLAGLGLSVFLLAGTAAIPGLVFGLWLTRGLGQSALSAASLTLAGHAARERGPFVMATYSILLSVGFMIAFPVVGMLVRSIGWRPAWAAVGGAVLALGGVAAFLLGKARLVAAPADGASVPGIGTEADFTLGEALATPAFWVFGLASSVYGLVASGIGLFNESILAELGFPPSLFLTSLAVTAILGLLGNFLGGWLLSRMDARSLLMTAMGLLAMGLLALPHLHERWMVLAQAAVMGLAGGLVTVLFFGYWGATFGRGHLGSIQGAAQLLTVVASATGPLFLARIQEWTGSYAVAFRTLAVVTALLGFLAWVVRTPRRKPNAIGTPAEAGLGSGG